MLQEKEQAEQELIEEKNRLMAIIRESSMELEKEKKGLEDRMQEQQRVIEVGPHLLEWLGLLDGCESVRNW